MPRISGLRNDMKIEIDVKEKKRAYNERVKEIEQRTFTPLVFSVMGGMSREYDRFYKETFMRTSHR